MKLSNFPLHRICRTLWIDCVLPRTIMSCSREVQPCWRRWDRTGSSRNKTFRKRLICWRRRRTLPSAKYVQVQWTVIKNIYYPFCFFWTHFSLYECMCVVLYHDTLESLLQKQCLEEEIVRLQRQLEMMETEYKLVDKTRVKALQVFKCMQTHFQYSTTGVISPLAKF